MKKSNKRTRATSFNREVVAVLHNIRSAHNVGSMFRTADGAGIKKLYLCGITPTPTDRFGRERSDFKKVALGADVSWEYQKSAITLIKKLKKGGYKIFAVEQSERSVSYAQSFKEKRIVLVVGNEVSGIPATILKHADKILEIPMRGSKESLNVSVAFGIVAYHFSS